MTQCVVSSPLYCSFNNAVDTDARIDYNDPVDTTPDSKTMTYACMIEPDTNRSSNEVVANHDGDHDDADVDGFSMIMITSMKFPVGDIQNFTNLISLTITSCNLSIITQSNIQFYKELMVLDLSHNKITVIEPELFKDNLQLVVINLKGNQIFHIDPMVFNGIQDKITVLNLMENKCTFTSDNATEVKFKVKINFLIP